MYHLIFSFVFITAFAIGTSADFTSPSPDGDVEDWQIGTNRSVVWTTTDTGITRLAVFDSTGNGYQIADNNPVKSPFIYEVDDSLDVNRNPWHFALFDDNNKPLFNSVNFDVEAADGASSSSTSSIVSPQSTIRSTTISTAQPTTITFATTTISTTSTSSSTTSLSPVTTPIPSPASSTVTSSTQSSITTGSTASATSTGGASSSGLSHSAAVGVGVGLGIGIPLLLVASGIGAFIMRRRSRRTRESSAFGIEYVDEAAKRQGR